MLMKMNIHLIHAIAYYISMGMIEIVFSPIENIDDINVNDTARLFTSSFYDTNEPQERLCNILFVSHSYNTIRVPVWNDIDDTYEKILLYETL